MAQRANQQLPEEIIGSANRRGVLLSLLGTLILVILCNFAAKWYLNDHRPNRGYWLVKEKWEMLLGLKQPVDWLILGDSSCNQGVVPSILNERLDVTSINLCTIGNMLSLNDAWMLEKYIQQSGAPKNVLIVHVYDVWHRGINFPLLARVPLSWGYWQELEPPLKIRLRGPGILFIERYFPLYSENKSLSLWFRFPLDTFKEVRSYNIEEDGFMVWEKPNPSYVEAQKESHINFARNNQFNLSPYNRQALERIVALAEEYGFNVYLANSPMYEGLYEHEDFQAYFNQLQETLGAYAAKSERVHYIFREPMTFPKEQMENADHLIYSAAKVYTNELVSEILSLQSQTTTSNHDKINIVE
ncbi:hypothetical protein BJP36_34850 [Moorena producens JHB]|uniref:SGNH/GDSL hydrolase family protein n=1 Tax=Moorena producens (strain JHB) TaxID=1454205 RepID=A0A1D9G9P0_MOOP1|nr:hypothetical protein [Moorena producens]AOY84337.1 hypothetical protein BJP36_34850 [Moorena producens JHB]